MKGYFKLKATPEVLGSKTSKLIMKIFGWNDIPFETITLSFKMKRQPSEREVEVMSNALSKAGIDCSQIKARWIPE